MEEENSRGTLRYEDITLAVPVPGTEAIDASAPCMELAEAIAGIEGIDLATCSGTFHEGYESIDEWSVEGMLIEHGTRRYYTGDLLLVRNRGVVVSWDSNYPCGSFRAYAESEAKRLFNSDYATFSNCKTRAKLYTSTLNPYYEPLSWSIEGRLWVQGEEHNYLVEAKVEQESYLRSFSLYAYARSYSVSR